MKSTRPPGRHATPRLPLPALAAAALTVLAAAPGCHRSPERPDVLLVTIDTLRSDHCSAYGYEIPTTPSLAALAARGTLYRHAYAEASTTAPSHAVIMTGRHFRTYGTTKNGNTLPEDVTTLAESMRDGGYATAGFVSSFPVMRRFGFAQGFEVFDDEFLNDDASIGRRRKEGEKGTTHDRLAASTLARVRKWIEARTDPRPLFMWVHFVDPHAPYKAPEKFEANWRAGVKRPVRAYDGEVHYADARLGELLDLVDRHTPERETLVIVTSDHGEGLGDHGWMYHGVNLHEEVVHVPLVASWPGHLEPGSVVDDPVGLVDIAPAILKAVGIEAPASVAGRGLFRDRDPSRPIFMQRRDYKSSHEGNQKISGEMTAILERGRKLILAPGEDRRELYDLGSDPRELTDLLAAAPAGAAAEAPQNAAGGPNPASGAHEADAKKLEDALAHWKKDFPAAASHDAPPDKETQKALRSLGYVD